MNTISIRYQALSKVLLNMSEKDIDKFKRRYPEMNEGFFKVFNKEIAQHDHERDLQNLYEIYRNRGAMSLMI